MAKRLQSPDMRHVRVGKDNTTITLEDEFWEQLRIIAVTRNVAISQLLAEIDCTMRLQPARPGYRRVRTRRGSGLRTADSHCTTFNWESTRLRAIASIAVVTTPRDASKQGGQDRVRTMSAAARSSSQRRTAAYSCE
jgi:predicted DNA-binding ribbon-helix-helix protein